MRSAISAGLLLVLAALIPLAGCAAGGAAAQPSSGASGKLAVVAAENFWGNIAAQLGGSHVTVTSIVNDPNADPHEYESNTNDARAFATAQYVIVNGAGYDTWSQKLLAANPVSGRRVLNVATLLGKHDGDNPHFWYNPTYVNAVVNQITKDYSALDPADAHYFTQQKTTFEAALQPYRDHITAIKARFAGVKVGATESIFVYLAQALGLDLVSPPAFMQAISEGNDPPVSTVAEFQRQIAQRQIKVLVYNVQTSTNVTDTLRQLAAQQHIPVVGISETMQPATTTFQQWQTSQLLALQNALSTSTRGS